MWIISTWFTSTSDNDLYLLCLIVHFPCPMIIVYKGLIGPSYQAESKSIWIILMWVRGWLLIRIISTRLISNFYIIQFDVNHIDTIFKFGMILSKKYPFSMSFRQVDYYLAVDMNDIVICQYEYSGCGTSHTNWPLWELRNLAFILPSISHTGQTIIPTKWPVWEVPLYKALLISFFRYEYIHIVVLRAWTFYSIDT